MIYVPGFKLYMNWCPVPYAEVDQAIVWEQRTIRIFGQTRPLPRLTAWYGSGDYKYSGIKNAAQPIPDLLARLGDRLECTFDSPFNSVLANKYRTGADCVSWHADDEPELGPEPVIASLSFGATRLFRVKSRDGLNTFVIALKHGDLLVMSGRSQSGWFHCLPRTTSQVGPRINLTYRYAR